MNVLSPILANQANQYGSLALSPVYRDGSAIPFSTFTWTKPDGTTTTSEYLTTNTPGIYKVKVTPNGSTAGCTTLSYIIKENFHVEQWEKAQNLNLQDGTAVTVIPIEHKSVEKTPIWYDTGIKDETKLKNAVVSKLLRYTLPNGTKQSEIIYILPTPYYLAHNNYLINGANFDGYVFAFSENEQQYLGGWFYRNGSPIYRATSPQYSVTKLCPFLLVKETATGDLLWGNKVPFDPFLYETIGTYWADCNSVGGTNSEDQDYLPQPDPIPNFPNCPGCGVPGWEWNKPRVGGGGDPYIIHHLPPLF